MNTNQGFSLIEVLFSLCLITGTMLGLLEQQDEIRQLFNLVSHQSEELITGHLRD